MVKININYNPIASTKKNLKKAHLSNRINLGSFYFKKEISYFCVNSFLKILNSLEVKFLLIFVFLLFIQCQSSKEERSIQSVRTTASSISNADIIRNPVTANQPIDTINIAKMEFESISYHYGEVEEGDVIEHTFSFTNTGNAPLIISNAKSTCGCTVPEWPKAPISVGESGAIKVKFNTANKFDRQVKPIFITANTHPAETKLLLAGTVLKRMEGEKDNLD